MATGEPILDFIVLGVSPDVDLDTPEIREALNRLAQRSVMGQYAAKGSRPPKALVMDPIEWTLTSDWRDVEKMQPGDSCPTCIAGNDQAVAFLKEHPDRRLALGNMRYWEVW
jgi:hypothetical protein